MPEENTSDVLAADVVAVVGSPSSNSEITLDLLATAGRQPLVGAMLCLAHEQEDGLELGLGTVTQVTTENQWHTNKMLRGVVKARGEIPGMSGDSGDVRAATIKIQAAYTTRDDGEWVQSGPSLKNSPPTGTAIRRLSSAALEELTARVADKHYLGALHGSPDVPLPLNMRDFSGDRGAFHMGVFGATGSGKALSVDTPIPTPEGWTRMGDLKDGDVVFDENGLPTRVVQAHPVMRDRTCYRVMFSDGSEIVADAGHNWYVETEGSRRSASNARRRDRRGQTPTLLPKETAQALNDLLPTISTDQVATLSEIAQLAGLSPRCYLVHDLLPRKVSPVGQCSRLGTFIYPEQKATRTRDYPLYDTVSVLTELLTLAESGATDFSPRAKERMRSEIAAPRTNAIPISEIARLTDRTTRGGRATGAIHKAVRRTGITPKAGPWDMEHHISAAEVIRMGRPATAYPLAAALKTLVVEGTRPVHDQSDKRVSGGVLTTEEIAATLLGSDGRSNYSIPVARSLATAEADLPIAPYTLGVWLGDGKSSENCFYGVDHEIALNVELDGYEVTTRREKPERNPNPDYRVWTIRGIRSTLTVLGLRKRSGAPRPTKHVPSAYLRSSEAQRRALLAGLLDTDGTVSKHGPVQFDNTNKALIDGVYELVASLGYRPTITTKRSKLYGKDCGPSWRVSFNTTDDVFRLERKRLAHKEATRNHNPAKNTHRYIVKVEKVETRPVRCITVDSPNNLYLAGKAMIPTHNTAGCTWMLAGQLRHRDQGLIIVDPQSQFSTETGLPLSLQGFAAALGREVTVARISEDLRLEKDAPLFGELLSKTRFFREITKMSGETQEVLVGEMVKALKNIEDWEALSSEYVLDQLCLRLRKPRTLRRIYSDKGARIRLMVAFSEILGQPCEETEDQQPIDEYNPDYLAYQIEEEGLEERRREALAQFAPLHNLFASTNPNGEHRRSLWGTVSRVFDYQARGNNPAPMLVLDMSTNSVSWLKNLIADDDEQEALDALRILDQDNIKAAILRQLFRTLKRAAESAFRDGANLNVNVVLDEAWRYAAPPAQITDPELKALSMDLAAFARDTRKFGIGWTFITQTVRNLNPDIWDQLAVRFIGYGLGGGDLDKVAEHLDDRDHLRLYKAFAPPDATSPKVYPFLLVGPVSPLSASKAPLTLDMVTDFESFVHLNYGWIHEHRLAQGLAMLTAAPPMPSRPKPIARPSTTKPAGRVRPEDLERVRANRDNGGVPKSAGKGLASDPWSFDGLAALEGDPPPF